MLTEHRFGAQVLVRSAEGYAIAYLDGTLAYVNPAMLWAARTKRIRSAKNLICLDCWIDLRSGVFDEPSIAVRRVLQSGEPYVRELTFPGSKSNSGAAISTGH